MAEIYTAQEMREAADNFWVGGVISEVMDEDGRVVKQIKHDAIIAMLRQAADAMEREAKRGKNKKKNYEYALRDKEGSVFRYHLSKSCWARRIKTGDETVVRREVGEWEEVKDED